MVNFRAFDGRHFCICSLVFVCLFSRYCWGYFFLSTRFRLAEPLWCRIRGLAGIKLLTVPTLSGATGQTLSGSVCLSRCLPVCLVLCLCLSFFSLPSSLLPSFVGNPNYSDADRAVPIRCTDRRFHVPVRSEPPATAVLHQNRLRRFGGSLLGCACGLPSGWETSLETVQVFLNTKYCVTLSWKKKDQFLAIIAQVNL